MKKIVKDTRNDGFYHVPNYPEYIVNKIGSVIHRPSGRTLKKYYDEDTELYMLDTNGIGPGLPPIHVILAETFIEEPDNIKSIDRFFKRVKFIDGDLHNTYLNNLTWTLTDKGLLQKKQLSQSRRGGSQDPIVLKHVKTGEIKKYNSLSHVAIVLKMSRNKLESCINSSNIVKRVNNHYIKIDDGSEWPIIKKNTVIENLTSDIESRVGKSVRIEVTHLDKTVKVYNSIREAARAMNLPSSTFGKRAAKELNILSTGEIIKRIKV